MTFCAVIITFYQRTLLGMSANQKRHYLKSYNNDIYFGELEFEPDAICKFMMLLCKSQLNENESQAAYIASHMFHEFKE
jgi:hypothetical protein